MRQKLTATFLNTTYAVVGGVAAELATKAIGVYPEVMDKHSDMVMIAFAMYAAAQGVKGYVRAEKRMEGAARWRHPDRRL